MEAGTRMGTAALRGDCARCVGLCCVVPAFGASGEFAIDKPARTPCPHLAGDFRCSIHAELPERGFRGCTVYDCFGAGQRVTRVAFAPGTDWRTPSAAAPAFAAFGPVRALHELLWYVVAALGLPAVAAAEPVAERLRAARDDVDGVAERLAGDGDEAATFDVDAVRDHVNGLLREASALARAGVARQGAAPELRGAVLVGADLRGRDLRAADLRGAVLVGADLRGADLEGADLTGADLRGARVDGGALRRALFVTPVQHAAVAPLASPGPPPGPARARERARRRTGGAPRS